MAGVRFGKDSAEFRFFREYWNFRQKYYVEDSENPQRFWDGCLAEADRIAAEFPGRYVSDLLQAHVNDVLRRSGKAGLTGKGRR